MLEKPCANRITRREVVQQLGAWTVFAGVLGNLEACTGGTGGATTTSACTCTETTGTNTGIKRAQVPAYGVAYNSGMAVFICHDLNGFYALSSLCPHQNCDMGSEHGFSATNVRGGFTCSCHGSAFDANGSVVRGPAQTALAHYKLGVDAQDNLWVDTSVIVTTTTCRCP